MKNHFVKTLSLGMATILMLTVAACGAQQGAEAPQESAQTANETAVENETAEEPAAATGETLEADGLAVTVPAEIAERVTITRFENDPNGKYFAVSETESMEAAAKEGWENADAPEQAGWLFSLGAVDAEQADEMRCWDMIGIELIGRFADGRYLAWYHPTDVRMAREDYNDEEGMARWTEVSEWAGSVREDLMKADGITPVVMTNTAVDIVLNRIARGLEKNYTVSTTEYGPLEPGDVDPAEFLDLLIRDVEYEWVDEEAPDGEYVVLTVPDEDARYDFFLAEGKENYVRRVSAGGYEELYKANFQDPQGKASQVMYAWYSRIAEAQGLSGENVFGYAQEEIEGAWVEKMESLCAVEIQPALDGSYSVLIVWPDGDVVRQWNMTATPLGDEYATVQYENGTHTVRTYAEDDSYTDEVVYEDGTGELYINSVYELQWVDEKEDAGANLVFVKAN